MDNGKIADRKSWVREIVKDEYGEQIAEAVKNTLAEMKDLLMLQLVGFMSEERRILEEKYGSGQVQEVFGEQKKIEEEKAEEMASASSSST